MSPASQDGHTAGKLKVGDRLRLREKYRLPVCVIRWQID